MKRTLVVLFLVVTACGASAGAVSAPPRTPAPAATVIPTTRPPVTVGPATVVPATGPPVTVAAATVAPTTGPPPMVSTATVTPTTGPPVTVAAATVAPTTRPPVTVPAASVPAVAPPVSVAFVGDSNVVRATGTIVRMLSGHRSRSRGGYVPSFFDQAGIPLAPAFWAAKLANPRFRPDVVVLNIGINDTLSPAFYADYGPKIDALMRLIPKNVPVLFPSYPYAIEQSARRAGAITVNHAWAMAQTRWPNLIIVPWGALANSHPEWINKSDPDPSQWVHYTPAGYDALTSLELATLDKLG